MFLWFFGQSTMRDKPANQIKVDWEMRTIPSRLRSRSQISYNMSQVRSKGSKIELLLDEAFRQAKLRPKKHLAVVGRPDFAFPRLRVAVFCDSHFWHGFRWRQKQKEIKRNREFWIAKIESNIRRDRLVTRSLRRSGWLVLRFWEHEIQRSAVNCVEKVTIALNKQRAVR